MVSIANIICVLVTLFICLILPLIVYLIYGMRNKGKGVWTAWLLGAAGFFVFQMIIRLPLLNIVALLPGFSDFVIQHYVLYSLMLAFTAALFEVAARYIVAKLLAKDLTYTKSFAAGLGHGSIEAIMIVGMTYVNNLLYIIMINTGAFDGIVAQTEAMGVDASQLWAIKDALINTAPATFLLAGYERILTVIAHIAMSMIVCYFVGKRKDFLGGGIALAAHWAMDFIAPLLNSLATPYLGNVLTTTTAYVLVYVFLTLVAVAAVIVIVKLKKSWKDMPVE